MSNNASQELSLISNRIVSNYLRSNGFHQTLDCFKQELLDRDAASDSEQQIDSTVDINLDLENLILKHLKSDPNYSNPSSNKTQSKDSDSDRLLSSLSSDFYSLKGPSTLPYKLQNTFNSLHTNNILSVKILHFPIRSFNSNPDSDSDSEVQRSAFKIQFKKCLVTTAADKTIVFFNPSNGDIIESLGNGKSRSAEEEGEGEVVRGHSSAVLAVEQNPTSKREMVSCGMDAKIVFWDLLLRRPFFSLNHHTKFVISVKFSPTGEYLASASYDGSILIYQRKVTDDSSDPQYQLHHSSTSEPEDPITGDLIPLNSKKIKVEYVKVDELHLKFNPESIAFIRSEVGIRDQEEVWDRIKGGREDFTESNGEIVDRDDESQNESVENKRTWLCFTIKNDCHLHYIPLPLSADNPSSSNLKSVRNSKLLIPQAFKLISFNINPSPFDTHVSFSLLSISIHPSNKFISVQTGDHSTTNTSSLNSTNSSSNSIQNISKILIFPLLSGERVSTLYTSIETSNYLNPRHCWNGKGDSIWLNSQDGFLRCLDLDGKIRCKVKAHGNMPKEDAGGVELSNSWRGGSGGNTIMKDLVVWRDEDDEGDGGEEKIVSVGFDRTVRVVGL